MLQARIALIDQTRSVSFEQLSHVAAALNLQVQRDLTPIWRVGGTVCALPAADRIPPGVWPIFVVKELAAGEGGAHLTRYNQPFAKVELGEGWALAASHECLGMLVDPSGNRLHGSNAIGVVAGKVQDVAGKFEYLLSVCDPSDDAPFAYLIDDVTVSDFYTPNYFDPVTSAGVRYSFSGALKRPREVLLNGYLSWFNPETQTVQQLRHFGAPKVVDLGRPRGASLRQFVDNATRTTVALSDLAVQTNKVLARAAAIDAAARARAGLYQAASAQIEALAISGR